MLALPANRGDTAVDVIKLQPGDRAPRDSDCARIECRDDGKFYLNASALVSCGDSSNEAESVAVVGSDPYDSYEAAESAALAWAASHGVQQLYVEPPEA
jgi:hypothetical protein